MIGAHCEGWHASPGSEEFDERRGRTRLRSRQDGTEPDIPQGWLLPYRVKPELVSIPASSIHVPLASAPRRGVRTTQGAVEKWVMSSPATGRHLVGMPRRYPVRPGYVTCRKRRGLGDNRIRGEGTYEDRFDGRHLPRVLHVAV